MNPGSVSIPKENSEHSYMICENGVFEWKNLEGGGLSNMEERYALLIDAGQCFSKIYQTDTG